MPEELREVDPPARRLPRDYYLQNFETLLSTVIDRYEDLLSATELEFVEKFNTASSDLKMLWVRLSMRSTPWFLAERLSYDEISCIPTAIDEGFEREMFAGLEESDIEEFISILTVRDLRLLQSDLDLELKSTLKQELIDELLESADSRQLFESIQRHWKVIRPRYQEVLRVLQLLYFGNFQQSLTDFVVKDLGLLRYEEYKVDKQSRLFNSREEIEQRICVTDLWGEAVEARAEGDLEALDQIGLEVREIDWHPQSYKAAHELLNYVGYEHERAGMFESAINYYEASELHPNRERKARVLEKMGDVPAALSVVSEIHNDWRCEEERHFVHVISNRLKRMVDLPYELDELPRVRAQELLIHRNSELIIEEDVLGHLPCTAGWHTQNAIWKSLFGLIFWDVIFAPIPGAFENRFQFGPLDLYQPEFVVRRRDLINSRLAEIQSQRELLKVIERNFGEKSGIANEFVQWHDDLETQVKLLLENIEHESILGFCNVMLSDLRAYRRGFPDLMIHNEDGVEFWEVKGPGDILSPIQRRWLQEFKRLGIPGGLLKVRVEG